MRPEIGAVGGDIDRNVADDADALLSGVLAQLLPLAAEFKLNIAVEPHLIGQLFLPGRNGLGLVVADIRFPCIVTGAAVRVLDRHIKRIVLQPVRVFADKILKFFRLLCAAVAVGLTQQCESGMIHLAVVDGAAVIAKVRVIALVLGQEPLVDQFLQIDQVRISGKGRERLIRGIAISCGAQRKDLPVCLARLHKEIYEFACRHGKAADAVRARQTENREQNTAFAHMYLLFL